LWREEPERGQAGWRGVVICANDGERCVFRNWSGLLAFFIAKLEEIEDDEKT
jgi:hypothetical protein